MKTLFASLLCHRDVEVFKLNWFAMRAHLDRGFDFQHLILNDGSLTSEDLIELSKLPGLFLDPDPVVIHNAPKAILLCKLQCLERGFKRWGADRVVVFDSDIFFFRNWEGDLRKMLTERAVVLRDWGSSLGPHVQQFKDYYGVHEDVITPNCNTGVISIRKEGYPLVEQKLKMHLANPFQAMEDQCVIFTAFYGKLSYANGIKCVINNAEYHPVMWDWFLKQNAIHLMGMRVRPDGLKSAVQHSLQNLPSRIHLEQFAPNSMTISWGMLAYGQYNFTVPWQQVPSTHNGQYIIDALYLHGGSEVEWRLPPRCIKFRSKKIVCMDTGIASNVLPITINNLEFQLNQSVEVNLSGYLTIKTQHGPGTHIAFIEPEVIIDNVTWPDLSSQLTAQS